MSQLLELCTGQSLNQVLWHTVNGCDVWQVDFGRCRAWQLNLSLLSCLLQTLHSHRVLAEIYAFFSLEAISQPVDDYLVEVITTQVSITIGRKYLEYAATELQDRDIECTTTKVEYSNLVSLVTPVSQSCSCRLIYDTLNVQTCNLTSLLCSLTLWVREVSRNCDYSICNLLSEIILCSLLHLLENHCRNLLWSILATLDFNTWITTLVYYCVRHCLSLFLALSVCLTHETLDRIYCVLRVCDGLTLSRITYLAVTILNETYYWWSSTLTFTVSDYNWFATFENGNTTVCGTQVNSNYFSHNYIFFYFYRY